VSVDTTTTIRSDIETIDVKDDEGDVQLPKATTAPSPGGKAAETPTRRRGHKGKLCRAPTQRAMLGRTKG
jgi:hypothetical protein